MTETIDVHKSQIKAANLDLLREKARGAKLGADLAEIGLAQATREESYHLIADDLVHEHYFIGAVDGANVHQATTHLAAWHRLDPECPMNVIIHSGGGSVLAGLSLFDQLAAYSERLGGTHFVTVTIRGIAASMAGVLVQAADRRVIGPESYLMVHELSAQTSGKIGELEDSMAFYKRIGERFADIFAARSGGRTSVEEFKELWQRKDVWLDSQQALEKGFVDEIG